ncbi:hypothetical protein SAMN06295967_103185 [Belliella buryatensis]|uniref:Signal transduction histidine kinase internal region domain-containing protein n=1 Tax=Belliella buryatensis TaxID=1500549 RepID=A0A239BQH8_9BACT|nr:histidine kinase [Belliella buryatensis]SNS10345.1 hypothetical protein SAMN06295967_103185 [Belliella buryatensis]
MGFKLKAAALLLLTGVLSMTLFAQQYPSMQYTTADGLPNNSIRALYNDSRDLLWIGTENGVAVRENGTFRNFTTADGLAFNNCWAIAEDILGNIWLGSYGGGLSFFDGVKFTAFGTADGTFDGRIRTIYSYKDDIFIGTENGVAIINISTLEVTVIPESIFDNQQSYISGFFEYEDRVFFTTYGVGLHEIIFSDNHVSAKKISDQKLIYSIGLIDDKLFTSDKELLNKFPLDNFIKGEDPENSYGSTIFWDFLKIPSGEILGAAWGIYSNNGGVYHLKYGQLKSMEVLYDIPSKEILQLEFSPKRNKLFVGTKDQGLFVIRLDDGLIYHKSDQYKIINIQELGSSQLLLQENGMQFTKKDQNGEFLIPNQTFKEIQSSYYSSGKKIPKFEDDFFELKADTKASAIEFYGMQIHQNLAWVNTNIGIYAFDERGKCLKYIPIHTYQFSFTKEGKLVETNPYGGVRIYEDLDKLIYQYYSKDLPTTPTQVTGIAASNGSLFFASVFTGLYEWNGKEFISYLDKGIWSELKFKHIKAYKKDQLVLATEFGSIFIVETNPEFRIVQEITRDVISGKNILFIESYEEHLFIGTEAGVNIYHEGNVRLINNENGLKLASFKQPSLLGSSLYLPVGLGYYHLSLDNILTPEPRQFDLGIGKLTINHDPAPESDYSWFKYKKKNITLSHRNNTIYLDLKPEGSIFPDQLQYRFRLNSNTPWSPFTFDRRLAFPYLPSGNYTLEVEVLDTHTRLSSNFYLLNIQVNPPFYLNPWFISFILIGLILIFVGIYHNRIRNYRQEEQKRIAIQNRINDLKIEALRSQLNPHFIFNAINSIQYYILNNQEEDAVEFLGKFSKLMRQTLDISSKKLITLLDDIKFIQSYIEIENERMGNRLHWNIDFIVDDKDLSDLKNYLVPPMLIQPFVENVFVHAFSRQHPNPELTISYYIYQEGILKCEITDNGRGIQAKNKVSLHESRGVYLIEERINLILQNPDLKPVTLTSQADKGTKVTLLIPYEKAPPK